MRPPVRPSKKTKPGGISCWNAGGGLLYDVLLSNPHYQSNFMKTTFHYRFTHTAISLISLGACTALGILSLSAKDEKKKTPPTPEEMQKAWQEASTPGAAHKVLNAYTGEWQVHTKMWMQPGAPPMESDGTAVAAWILGGRYVEMTVHSTMMGQPFEGRAITGYDNLKKAYTSFWVDNMGTGMTTSSGSASADGKTFTFEGKMDDVMTGEKDKTYKFIDQLVSKDEIHSEIHDVSLGANSKIMEMTYKRKK